ncbi:UNVERIFIED_CONTAM: hypothetical protein Sindi_0254100 [Sesamum indicum]
MTKVFLRKLQGAFDKAATLMFKFKDLGLEKERRRGLRREEETEGGRRGGGAESGVDERKAEALAVEMRDLESEPRQAIVAVVVTDLCVIW